MGVVSAHNHKYEPLSRLSRVCNSTSAEFSSCRTCFFFRYTPRGLVLFSLKEMCARRSPTTSSRSGLNTTYVRWVRPSIILLVRTEIYHAYKHNRCTCR